MTPSGIEPATFRFVAQHLNHSATAVPRITVAVVIFCRNARGIFPFFGGNLYSEKIIFYWASDVIFNWIKADIVFCV